MTYLIWVIALLLVLTSNVISVVKSEIRFYSVFCEDSHTSWWLINQVDVTSTWLLFTLFILNNAITGYLISQNLLLVLAYFNQIDNDGV